MSIYKFVEVSGSSFKGWDDATQNAVALVSSDENLSSLVILDKFILPMKGNQMEYRITAKAITEVVNHKSIFTYMKSKSKSHAAPKAVKKAAAKKAPAKKAPAKKAAAKKAPAKKAAAKKAAPKKAAAKKAAPKKAAAKKAAPKKAAKKK